MADENLTEDEINALLSGVDTTLEHMQSDKDRADTGAPAAPSPSGSPPSVNLSLARDAMQAVLKAHEAKWSSLYQKNPSLSVADLQISSLKEIQDLLGFPVILGMSQEGSVLLSEADALRLATLASGTAFEGFSDEASKALQSLWSQLGAVTQDTLSTSYHTPIRLGDMKVHHVTSAQAFPLRDDHYLVMKVHFEGEGGNNFHYYALFSAAAISQLRAATKAASQEAAADPFGSETPTDLDSLLEGTTADNVDIKSAEFMPLSAEKSKDNDQNGNISLLLDVPMEVTVELGRSTKSIKEILSLGEGAIIELDKLAGEPVDLLVNRKLIAKGEVVVIDENFGVRVTEIISPKGRMDAVE